ncbi:MAG: 16S rRNA (guanine(966)-N(2))-methyltransferase RsmD [Dehalococcoidia bacterium]|nr:16S rRNA (guanine(966)-N(2))-methyltransferase RsmD [Dehalococcoidia bacterium]
MRVIGGKVRGRTLKSVHGGAVRPTSDIVREAVFSMLESVAVDWSRVLDLYAGTGAMGIEALSRGAERADFVERNPRLCRLIKENLQVTGFTPQATVYCMSVNKIFPVLKDVYGIVLVDPPYEDPSISAMISKLASSPLVGEESTLVVEHSKRVALENTYGDFDRTKDLRHGDTCVSVYQYAESGS